MKKLLLLFAAALGSVSSVLAQASPLGGVSCPNGYNAMPSVFAYTGTTETFTVPAGVTSIHITAYAPKGGDGVTNGTVTSGGYPNPQGGAGGYVQGFLSVTPGEVLYITIGGKGQDAVATGNANATNAFNRGGSGGYSGAGGSGATDIIRGGTIIMVAGGGGGAGGNGCSGTVGVGYQPYGGDGGNADAVGSNGEIGVYNASVITGGSGGLIGNPAAAGVGCATYPGGAGNVNGNGGVGPSYNACLAGGRLSNGGGGGGGYVQGSGGGSGAVGTTSCSGNVSSGGGGGAGGANYISSDFTSTNIASTGALEGGVIICMPSVVVMPVVGSVSVISGSATPCSGTAVTLEVAGNLGSASNWAWYYNGVYQTSGTTYSFIAPTATSALIQVRGEGGTVGTTASFYDYPMTINPSPFVSVTPFSGTYCGNVTQVATGGVTYLWSNGNTTASNTVTAPSTQLQSVTVSDANGCTASTTTNVFAYPQVFTSAAFDSNSGMMIATSSGGNGNYIYEWSFLGNPIPGATGPTYTPTANGFYTVLVNDTDGFCSSNSTVNISNVGVDNVTTTTFTMSPNPTTGVLVLDNLTIGKNFRLVNALGQLVKSFEATSTQMTLDITAQPAGTYFLQSEGQAFSIIKQ